MAGVPMIFFSRCGLRIIIRICVPSVPRSAGWSMPRGGFPTYDKVFELYGEFVGAGVDILPLTIDSNTRLNDYAMAKKMLALSEETDENMLNGYPLVNHGYRVTRKMVTHYDTPISLRHGTPDARLLVEVALASGIFEIEGGPILIYCHIPKTFH